MKRNIVLSVAVAAMTSSLYAVDDLSSMFTEGKASGQVRLFYIDRDYSGFTGAKHRNGTAIGGHLKFETAAYNGLSFGVAGYTTNRIFRGLEYGEPHEGKVDPSLFGTGHESYSILGEAYLHYDLSQFGTKTSAKLGYQRYDVPMMGSDDARMLPNTFEAYKFVNSDLENVTFQVAQVNRIAYGTFSNIYGGGILGATAGYPIQGNVGTGKYINMGEAAVGKNTNGVTNAMVSFKNKNFHAKLSNDYAWDLYNTIYADAGATWTCLLSDSVKPFVAVQVIKQDSAGDNYMKYSPMGGDGEIDSLFFAGKIGAKSHGVTAYVAYSETGGNDAGDASYNNAIISQFGGMPAYTQGMVTRHQFLAGTKAWKAVGAYSFKEQGVNLSAAFYYASFDMDENNGYSASHSWTASEPGFDIKYYPAAVKNLQLRLRGNFPDKFYESDVKEVSWNEYRFIVNYNF